MIDTFIEVVEGKLTEYSVALTPEIQRAITAELLVLGKNENVDMLGKGPDSSPTSVLAALVQSDNIDMPMIRAALSAGLPEELRKGWEGIALRPDHSGRVTTHLFRLVRPEVVADADTVEKVDALLASFPIDADALTAKVDDFLQAGGGTLWSIMPVESFREVGSWAHGLLFTRALLDTVIRSSFGELTADEMDEMVAEERRLLFDLMAYCKGAIDAHAGQEGS